LRFYIVISFLFFFKTGISQLNISGRVLDKSKLNVVETAKVISTGGMVAYTDSMGRYHIPVHMNDSIYFIYNGKPTQKFPVAKISNPQDFDISLMVDIPGKYRFLKEVVLYSKNYKQDSIENREAYADIFNYEKPGLSTSISPTGGVGADLDELINVFRFKRKRRLKTFQMRLEAEEQEKYVTYRFNKKNVGRITGLQSPQLDSFLVWYRPSYDFASQCDELSFNQYILNAFYQFKKLGFHFPIKKEDPPLPGS